jgi:hypothetical protein
MQALEVTGVPIPTLPEVLRLRLTHSWGWKWRRAGLFVSRIATVPDRCDHALLRKEQIYGF